MKKIFSIFSILIMTLLALLCVNNVIASEEVSLTIVPGASIRTTGTKQGIKFSATALNLPITTDDEGNQVVAEHGFYIIMGTIPQSLILNEINADSPDGYIRGNKLLKKEVAGSRENFSAVIYGIPETSYEQDITVMAYAIVNDELLYTDVVTKNISEVGVAEFQYRIYQEKQAYQDIPEIISDVFNATRINYDFGMPIYDSFQIQGYRTNEVVGGLYTQFDDSGTENFSNLYWDRILIKYDDESGLWKSVDAIFKGETLDTTLTFGTDYDAVIAGYRVKEGSNITNPSTGEIMTQSEDTKAYCEKIVEFIKIIKTGGTIYFDFDAPTTKGNNPINIITSTTSYLQATAYDEQLINASYDYINLSKTGYAHVGWVDSDYATDYYNNYMTVNHLGKKLTAVWQPIEYTINYVTDGGTLVSDELADELMPSSYTIESSPIILPDATQMTKENHVFLGWYTEPTFENRLAVVSNETAKSLTLYAKWLEKGTTTFIVDNSTANGADNTYSSIPNAIEAIKAANLEESNPTIIVLAGSGNYSEDVTINFPVTITGPNEGVPGNAIDRDAEAVITGDITINANNVTIDGIALAGNASINLDGATNTVLTNIYSTSEGVTEDDAEEPTYSGYPMVIFSIADVDAKSSTIEISNSRFYSASTTTAWHAIGLDAVAKDITIKNNEFINSLAAESGLYASAIRLNQPDGYVMIKDNVSKVNSDNYTITVGRSKNTSTIITIRDNKLIGTYTAGVDVQYLPANSTLEFVGNTIENLSGNMFNFDTCLANSVLNIKYNNFSTGTSYQISKTGNGKINYASNYYANAQTTTTDDYGKIESNELREIAYYSDAYYNPETAYTVTLDYNYDGVENGEYPSCIGYNVPLPEPTRLGYKFLGWTVLETSTSYISKLNLSEKPNGEYILYAQWGVRDALIVNDDATDEDIDNGVYKTISKALEEAQAGDIIRVLEGTYKEDVTINLDGIQILGPNEGVPGTFNTRAINEATVTGLITINANNIILDGIALEGTSSAIVLNEVDTVNLTNLYISGSKEFSDNSNKPSSIFANNGIVSNLVIENCYINADVENYRTIYINTVNNLVIKNNFIDNGNQMAEKTANNTAIGNGGVPLDIDTLKGNINIANNEIGTNTINFLFYLGNKEAEECTELTIKDNNFTGTKTTTIGIYNITHNNAQVHFVGNILNGQYSSDNNFDFTGTTVPVNVKYNYFDKVTYDGFKYKNASGNQITTTSSSSNIILANNFFDKNVDLDNGVDDNGLAYTNTQRIIAYLSDEYYNPDTAYDIIYDYGYGVSNGKQDACIGYDISLEEPTRNGYSFLGWSEVEGSTTYITKLNLVDRPESGEYVLYANWGERTPLIVDGVGEETGHYENITLALAAAQEGDVIQVLEGTYNETVTINTKGIQLIGPNKGINGISANRTTLATITGRVTINVDDVTIDGMDFVDDAVIVIGGNNVTIQNVNMEVAQTVALETSITLSSSYRYGCIIDDNTNGTISNLSILDSYIVGTKNTNCDTILTFYSVNNLTIARNYLATTKTAITTNYEGVFIENISGQYNFVDNEYYFPTEYLSMMIGYESNTATKINIIGNTIGGSKDNTLTTAGIAFRHGTSATEVVVRGNVLKNFIDIFNFRLDGTTEDGRKNSTGFSVGDIGSGAQYTVEYNLFDSSCKYQVSYSDVPYKLEFNNNCYLNTESQGNDTIKYSHPNELIYAYKDAYPEESINWELETYTVTYNTDGGNTIEADTFTKLNEVTLPTPTKEKAVFIGWFDSEGNVVTQINQYQNYELTARWNEETQTISYNTDGGVAIEDTLFTNSDLNNVTLPIPTKERHDFLGWYEHVDSNSDGELDSFVKVESITEFRNYELIAYWQSHEYTINYELNGGTSEVTQQTAYIYELSELEYPIYTEKYFLGWTTSADGTDNMYQIELDTLPENSEITLYANWGTPDHVVGEGKEYTTLSALLAATETVDEVTSSVVENGDVILMLPGTYSDAITLNKSITVIGSNYNRPSTISESNRLTEAEFNGDINIYSSDVEINGIKVGSIARIKMNADVSNITIKSVYFDSDASSTSNQHSVSSTYVVTNFVMDNCRLVSDEAYVEGYNPVLFSNKLVNGAITNNYFHWEYSTLASGEVLPVTDAIEVERLAGTLDVSRNNFDICVSNQWIVLIRNTDANATFKYNENIVKGIDQTYYTGPVCIGSEYNAAGDKIAGDIGEGLKVEIIGNEFVAVDAYIIRIRATDESDLASLTIKYNTFVDCDNVLRLYEDATVCESALTSGKVVFSNNYISDGSTEIPVRTSVQTSPVDVANIVNTDAYASIEECQTAYEQSK